MIVIKTKDFSDAEIRQSVRIQIEELDQGFLSSFGSKALEVIFFHAASSRWGILVIAIDSERGDAIGYVFGSDNINNFYKDFIVRKIPAAVIHFLPKMLSLQRIRKAFETLVYPMKNTSADMPRAELLDLAVSRSYHGKGVAQKLFDGFANECRVRGVTAFKIPTSASLVRAHRFYEKMGAKKAGSVEVHRGQEAYVYVYEMKNVSETSQE